MNVIPAIDLRDGKCVRLFQGDFEKTTQYSDDPVAVARRFSALDVTDLHIVDLDGARCGEQKNRRIVQRVAAETGHDIQLGGGIRDRSAVANWLNNGVRRCVIGSIAINDHAAVKDWLQEFGGDRLVLALDVKIREDGAPILTTHGWTDESGISLWDCLNAYSGSGVRHVLCTDVSRDGAMAGPNIDLYVEILRRFPKLTLQASGGVRNIGDLECLRSHGIPAAITGRALLEGKITEKEVASFRQSA